MFRVPQLEFGLLRFGRAGQSPRALFKAAAPFCLFAVVAAVVYGPAPSSRAEADKLSPDGNAAVGTEWLEIIPHPEATREDNAQVALLTPSAAEAVATEDAQAASPPEEMAIAPDPGAADASATDHTLVVARGDTIMRLLLRGDVPRDEAVQVIRAMRRVYDPRLIVPGQKLTLAFEPGEAAGENRLSRVRLSTGLDRAVSIERHDGDAFQAKKIAIPLETRLERVRGTIKSSLYEAGMAAGMPSAILVDLVRMYSWDVDFQRDIRPGDGFDVAYERFYLPDGTFVRIGKIIYASLTVDGTPKRLYLYKGYYGTGYFDEKGEGNKKPLMRTPIDGARITSGFGRRRDPFLGYTMMHRGVDFGARPGTPVYAAGDGRIVYAGRNGGYGRYVRIRHNSRYETAYGHMRAIRHGIHPGVRVKQGQVIGYVGETGRATGPHLHYEILIGGDQVNPLKVKLPSWRRLRGKELAAFQAMRGRLDHQIAGLGQHTGPTQLSSR